MHSREDYRFVLVLHADYLCPMARKNSTSEPLRKYIKVPSLLRLFYEEAWPLLVDINARKGKMSKSLWFGF